MASALSFDRIFISPSTLHMDPFWKALFAVEAVLIFSGLWIRFLARNRWSDAAGPSHMDGANLQETNGENGPSGTSELVALGHKSENLSFPGSVSAESGHEFEVFLSFRGADIRKTFADCLYHYLINLGVRTFRDNEELHVGKEIGPDLMKAIKQSKISIPIFTGGYASSKWCLREVAEMVKWMKEDISCKQVIIMPIFLDVTPDEVQHQTGSYAEAFAQHEKKFDPETVKGWRDALREVGRLKGLELSQAANGNQGEFIKLVVAEVLRELRQAWLDVSENLVGLDEPAEEVMQMLEDDLNGTQMVGIWGTGGIGKTTLAKYVYNRIADHFEGCSFLGDVRETSRKPGGLLELQRKLASDILGQQNNLESTYNATNILKSRLRGKKAIILLDDVDDINQLKALAADPSWFGSGSRIMVTTREKAVLNQFPWFNIYELKQLDEDLALELFCKYAFRDDLPSTEFVDLSRYIVQITGGLPLALVVTGSSLYACRGKKDVWNDTIQQLKKRPHMDVQEKLRISCDALDAEQKEIFLDIACFFIGWDYQFVVPMWHDCEFSPSLGIEVLQLKSLIKIGDDDKLQMHDQLRDLGRHIVEQESRKEPELRSRLWRSKDAINVLRGLQGTSKIEGVVISPEEKGVIFSEKCFQTLSKLRILQLSGDVELTGDYQHLLPKLRLLRWSTNSKHPPASLPLNNLVVLDLSYSRVNEDWTGWKSIKMRELKVLDLSQCYHLKRTPGFSSFPNLERLILEGCAQLVSIGPSIELLKNLNFLNLRWCSLLKKLPNQLGYLEALTVLIIDHTMVEEIPISARMKKIEFLSANGCLYLKCVPESIGSLENLKWLSLEDCHSLRKLPETIGQLKSLVELRLQDSGITYLPKTMGDLKELRVMDASQCFSLKGEIPIGNGTVLRVLKLELTEDTILPASISGLSHLQTLYLYLGRCRNQRTLPELPSSLISLKVEGSLPDKENEDLYGNHTELKKDCLAQLCKLEKLVLRAVNIRALPKEIGSFSHLKEFEIYQCTKLECFPTFPSNLFSLKVDKCRTLRKFPSLSNLRKLSELSIVDTRLREIVGLGDLISLQRLSIDNCPLTKLDGVERLESLCELSIRRCDIERLPELSNLRRLCGLNASNNRLLAEAQGDNNLPELKVMDLSCCESLERLFCLSNLKRLELLNLASCQKLTRLKLCHLDTSECEAIEKLPELLKQQSLKCLNMSDCERLIQLDGIGELVSLECWNMSNCKAIEKLVDLSKLQSLEYLCMSGCERLIRLDGIGELVSLVRLDISGCKAIEKLPDLSRLQRLENLDVTCCERLLQLDGIGELVLLKHLDVTECEAIEKLGDLSNLQSLEYLNMSGCEKLIQLDGIGELVSLNTLDVSGCNGIDKLPDLSKLQRLERLNMKDCKNIRGVLGLEKLGNLQVLCISGCKLLNLPNLSHLQFLRVER